MQLAAITPPIATPGFTPMTIGHVLDGVYPGAKENEIVSTNMIASGFTRDRAIEVAKALSLGADRPGLAVGQLTSIGTYQVYEIARKDATTGASALYHFEGIDNMAGAPFPYSNLRREVLFVDGNTVFGGR